MTTHSSRPRFTVRPAQVGAFTLVEMLVVIGVVVVLLSMLVPALQKAREQARLFDCLTRIRQCAIIALGNYTGDNRGAMLPPVGHIAGMPNPPQDGYNIFCSDF